MNTKNTNETIFHIKHEGQSAIEYLMTYGWMLLVVAIVGGSIFSTVSGQCLNDVTGFTGQTVEVSDYALTQDSIQVEIRSSGDSNINDAAAALIEDGEVIMAGRHEGATIGTETTFPLDEELDTSVELGQQGSTAVHHTDTASQTSDTINEIEGCNEYDIRVYYITDGFDDAVQTSTGTIQGSFEPDL